jgi:hypothetical protein
MKKARPFRSEPSCSPASFRACRGLAERVVCTTDRPGASTLFSLKNQLPPPPALVRAGGRSAPTLRTAGRRPAPCVLQITRSSRHRSHRRRVVIGANHERKLSLHSLQCTAFSGRKKRDCSAARNQMPSLPVHQYIEAHEPSPDRRQSDHRRLDLWLHVPQASGPSKTTFAVSPCAPVTPESISDCISRNPDIELFVMSSGTPKRRPLSSRAWMTRPWLQRLFGTISDPLMAARCAGEFTSSLPVIHASPSASLDTAEAQPIRAICGQKSHGSLTKSDQNGCSQKMSKGTSIWDLPTSSNSFAAWTIAAKRDCSARLKRAQATGVTGSSFWPTPTVQDHGNAADIKIENGDIRFVTTCDLSPRNAGQFGLSRAARSWTILWLAMQSLGWIPGRSRTSSLLVHLNFKTGLKSFHGSLTSNPRFHDWMMGWPENWTSATDPVTEYAAWLRRSRGQLSRLLLRGTHHN